MTSDDNQPQLYRLSRRNVLAGLGTIGLASAGAGLGTSAFFSDEESFEDNTLTAGSLDLRVQYEASYDSDGAVQNLADSAMGTQDGTPASTFYNLDDVKPGDSGHVEFCFDIVDNPAYVWACADYSEAENGMSEPEMDVDQTPDEGELADSIEAELVYCDEDGEPIQNGEIVSGSLAEVLDAIRFGAALDGDGVPNVPGEQSPHDTPMTPQGEATYVTGACICLFWEIPYETVGNEIQTDSLSMNFEFHALQSRHNDGTTNPCLDGTTTVQYDNDWKGQTLGNPTDGSVTTDVAFGPDNVGIRFTFEDDGDGVDFLDTADYSSTNLPVVIDGDADGTHDFQLIWQPNAGFPDAPFGYQENNGGSYSATTALPAGFSAAKNGNEIVFTVPRTEISSTFRLLAYGSTGGEGPIAEVNTDPALGPDFYNSSNAVSFSE
ncbi:SipW-dependent-type signal peptide-containing protein [Halosegnis longus]|uniref:SipW-cognate class signal peptide n=1 Tax=Halosegnis longus TaxID=2216012 RepID=A0AAJ4RAM4_9EURY|nr:SipW-dependent-type signal peptide-containing protein [Halosegnis longus]RNJ27315.1 hypothetical protein Nmn1133_11915 [Salella cibi]